MTGWHRRLLSVTVPALWGKAEDEAQEGLNGIEKQMEERKQRAILRGLAANAGAWLAVHCADLFYHAFFVEHEDEEQHSHRRLSGFDIDSDQPWYMDAGKMHASYNNAVLVCCSVVLVLCALAGLRFGRRTWNLHPLACAFFAFLLWPFPLTVPSSMARFLAEDAEKNHFVDDSIFGFFRAVIVAMSFGLSMPLCTMCSAIILSLAFLSMMGSCLVFQIGEGGDLMLGILGTVVALGFSLYGSKLLANALKLTKQAEEQVQELKERHTATRSLLSHFCDCVIKLGPKYTLLEASPQLATFLFRRSIPAGTQFCDHLASDEERTRFTSAVESAMGADDKPQREALVIPVRFKDCAGREVGAHIHLVHEQTPDGGSGYLLGVAENAGRSGAGARQGTDGGEDDVAALPLRLGSRSASAGVDGMTDGASSAGDTASSAGESTSTTGTANPVQVDITLAPSMRVAYTSPAFQVAFGVANSAKSFSHWLEDPDSFCAWLQAQREDVMANTLLLPAQREYGFASVRCSGTGACHKMWLSVRMPKPTSENMSNVKGLIETGNYKVSIRLDPPTGNAARRGQRRMRRARSSPSGTRQDSSSGALGSGSPAAASPVAASAGGLHVSL